MTFYTINLNGKFACILSWRLGVENKRLFDVLHIHTLYHDLSLPPLSYGLQRSIRLTLPTGNNLWTSHYAVVPRSTQVNLGEAKHTAHAWSTWSALKECVARMTCLYKNNGAVSCVVADFLFIWSPSQQYQERMSACADVTLYRIYWWAVSKTNCNTFLYVLP